MGSRTVSEGYRAGSNGEDGRPVVEDDGSFVLRIASIDTGDSCSGLFPPAPVFPHFPPPDQIEVTVVRNDCEQVFVIDIDENTVVDLDFPDDVIELVDPILVPPCEQDTNPQDEVSDEQS